ncbi:unnamed protein product [Microthlaspi erraticum]|uniref:Uncharacterized protein n=1 Tax=Microthlaspi erraticum TaxID=1685480 RepID=A0A6D2KD46_9BRAS|nr:unnamed protein product [Microthlaspi erraticum]
MAAEQIQILSVRLAKRLRIYRDYATGLLVANNWDEEFILTQWTIPGNPLASLIDSEAEFHSREIQCYLCNKNNLCKPYGCGHLFGVECVKGYIERNIASDQLNIRCLQDGSGVMMCAGGSVCGLSAKSFLSEFIPFQSEDRQNSLGNHHLYTLFDRD